jgi:hypothetical protein
VLLGQPIAAEASATDATMRIQGIRVLPALLFTGPEG